MDGIHIHPHDILDEGSHTILKHVENIGGIHYIFPQVNTIFERSPYPSGSLTHNPVHEFVMGNGTLHAKMNPAHIYPHLHQRLDSTIENGEDPIRDFKKAAEKTSIEVVPWFNILNGDFAGNLEENSIYNVYGEKVNHWLCTNGPDVLKMWTEMITTFIKKYDYHTIMIDRIRYPDWAGETVDPSRMFSCFCENCKHKMVQSGINLSNLEKDIQQFIDEIQRKSFHDAVQFFQASSHIKNWIAFRQNSISNFVEQLISNVTELEPKAEFWLDLWPPSYAWFLGQDYTALTKLASKLKHFPYHKLGGGADVQGLIESIANNEVEYDDAFGAFLYLFDIDQTITYETFKQRGYPIHFVTQENEKVRKLSRPGTVIFSGVQMWNIDNESLIEAIEATRKSAADHLIYYCYGWAEITHFEAIAHTYNK